MLEMEPLGLRIEFLRTAEETGGELVEADVTGRPRGLLAQRHVHPDQAERLEVIEGTMKVTMNGREHIPRPVAEAKLVLEHADAGYAAMPSLRVQRAVARTVPALARGVSAAIQSVTPAA